MNNMPEYECLSDFIPDIKMEIGKVDDRTILMMLGVAQAKFCRDTRVLQQLTIHNLDGENTVYPCIPQYEGFNQSIDTVMFGRTERGLYALRYGDAWTIAPDRNSVHLSDVYLRKNYIGYLLHIVTTIIPYKDTQVIDPNIYELYSNTILVLTRHLLYNQNDKEWSNERRAASLLYEYNELLNSVNFDRIAGGNTTGNQSINLDF